MAGELAEDTWPFEVREVFAPQLMTTDEMEFLEKHLEESPIVAFASPDAANLPPDSRTGLRAVLSRFNELSQLQQVHGFQWCGFGTEGEVRTDNRNRPLDVRSAIALEKAYRAGLQARREQSPTGYAPQPTMYNYTNWGERQWQGIGSDRLRARRISDLRLVPEGGPATEDWTGLATKAASPETTEKGSGPDARFELIEGNNYYECPVIGCNHRTTFKPESPQSRNMARMHMGKHMIGASESVQDHRAAHSEIFH